jgi:hypothetical protein
MVGVAEIIESVVEPLRASVDRVVGTAVGCVWLAAITLAELAELATALMTEVADAFALLMEAEVETGDDVAAART